MSTTRVTSTPALLIGAGILLLGFSAYYHIEEVTTINRLQGPLAAFILDGVLAVGVATAGYWLTFTRGAGSL
ncbi:hypothetical protein PNP59_14140 [Halobacterium salinarum]|uniref:hypothetical protein n=1 Tax=Halobacterium salinarum TaxID=2242 RepID=UPI002554EA6D|nr:hypothetical protein [Halobacterium salinarum]MDL0132044.1 hypothetical protein [Halobacterium salinarum]